MRFDTIRFMDSRCSSRMFSAHSRISWCAADPDTKPLALNRQKHNQRSFASKKRNESQCGGMILVVLLMSVAVLSLLVIHMQVTARTALAGERRLLLHARLQAAVDDAAWRALGILASDDNLLTDHTNEPWARPVSTYLPDGIFVHSVMEDENRRLDFNALSVASAFANAREPDSFVADVLSHIGVQDAENAARALSRAMETGASSNTAMSGIIQTNTAYLPKSVRLFESLDEVLCVLPAVLPSELLSLTTVLPDSKPRLSPININTATPDLLVALFGEPQKGIVDWLCIVRSAHPLESISALTAFFPNARDAYAFNACLDVKSSYFSLRVDAVSGGAVDRLYVLLQREDAGTLRILRWIRG